MFDYMAYGLTIRSDYKLPPLNTANSDKIDLIVQKGEVSPNGISSPTKSTDYYQTAPSDLWLDIEDVARFLVTDGSKVIVDAYEGADEQSIRLFLLGSCFGAALHQRHQLVIHGNAIRFGDSCVIFAGDSGNGKSTLAAALHQRGYEVLADDLAVIDKNNEVQPGYPQMKLWEDSAKRLGIDVSKLKKILYHESKYALPIRDGFCNIALPLRAIYLLDVHDEPSFIFQPLKGFEKFSPLQDNTYRINFLEGFGLQSSHLKRCSELANHTEITRIHRPSNSFQIDELVKHIEEDLRS